MAEPEPASAAGQIDGVQVDQLREVFWLLREKLPEVLAANRFFEEHTGFHNEAGANNLVDALSHIATLVEEAEELGPDGQREQVAHLEDHLRRSMMEAFEQIVRYRAGEIAEYWELYMGRARPLAMRNGTPDVAPLEELNELRVAMKEQLESGRKSKRKAKWEDWEEGTQALMEACETSDRLLSLLQDSIAAAEFDWEQRRQRWLALAVATVGMAVGAAGILINLL